jgi:hypothetical protein
MSRNLQNMPARYQAQFSQWRNTLAGNTYQNTGTWVTGINSGQFPAVTAGYHQATTQLLHYNPDYISGMTDDEQARVKSQYATVELVDGANTTAMAAIGSIRGNAQNVQTQIANLEQDSLSADPNLNTEISVLNKINAAGVLRLLISCNFSIPVTLAVSRPSMPRPLSKDLPVLRVASSRAELSFRIGPSRAISVIPSTL